jgi:hypothetical protein
MTNYEKKKISELYLDYDYFIFKLREELDL